MKTGLMLGTMAMLSAANETLMPNLDFNIRYGEPKIYNKSPLTKKQQKARAKSKAARKARRRNK
jgi:hypothetical protein